jgi:uncharacterized protein
MQCGKATISKIYSSHMDVPVHFLDLEDPEQRSFLTCNKKALDSLDGFIIIDEIQLVPELFQYLRVLVDNSDKKFLILGSASRVINQSSETLAGRISYVYLHPFSLSEVKDSYNLWLTGGFHVLFLLQAKRSVSNGASSI